MNPFLEPTVATPETAADWQRPSIGAEERVRRTRGGRVRRRPVSVLAGPPDRPKVSGDSSQGRVAKALRALTLLGALLLPGLAAAVDINTATPQQLQEIKGIGPKTAGIIIEERERGGRFESFSDISERVKGIGPKKAASLQAAGLTVGGSVAQAGRRVEPDGRTAAAANRRGR